MSSSSATTAKPYTAGHEPKSLLINLATILLICTMPVWLYVEEDVRNKYVMATVLSFVAAFLAPPLGWKRPHPYSDVPENRPKQR